MTPTKILPQVRTGSALGKCVETHFVPALAVVRSEIGTRETMKHRCKHRSENRHETVTNGLADLRRNRRNERSQAGLDRLAGWPFSLTSRVTRYTRFIPSVCYKRPIEQSRQKAVRFPHWPMTDLR
jgi:hypothetical protein